MTEDVDLSFEEITFGDEKNDRDEPIEEKLKELDDDSQEPDENVVLVTTELGGKQACPFSSVITFVKENVGPLKTTNYREKQSFGFLQFHNGKDVERAIEKLNGLELDGTKINAEITTKITPGRDPRTHDFNSEFKNSTLVLKNLPFQLKLEQLEEILSQYEWKYQNVSYLYDSSGMFRGMAFVKFKEIDHAMKVFEVMNGMDIQGRKLRIEYKKKVKEETPEEDTKRMMEQLLQLSAGSSGPELAFPCVSSYQRKQLHHLAEKLGLGHYSTGEGENRYVIVKRKDSKAIPPLKGTPPSKGQPIKVQRSRRNSEKQKNSYEQRQSFDSQSGSFDRGSNSRSFGFGGANIRSPPSSLGRSPVGPHSYSHPFHSVGSIPTPTAPLSLLLEHRQEQEVSSQEKDH